MEGSGPNLRYQRVSAATDPCRNEATIPHRRRQTPADVRMGPPIHIPASPMERDCVVSPSLALRASLEFRSQKSNDGHPEEVQRRNPGAQASGYLESPLPGLPVSRRFRHRQGSGTPVGPPRRGGSLAYCFKLPIPRGAHDLLARDPPAFAFGSPPAAGV
jgi:hypothetical protein